ncbi:class II aaRS and biotin synthetase [Ascobolus immersus RN42]|uniref:threonine--tRNA ligase n=1 Tax=Ascobolus immersus RN42 TaxID=1160509 RepID=A0A3N4HFH1_ASCIM|nr:class II aaRS and biotin synthetase [Ascobolus immersus RN42]
MRPPRIPLSRLTALRQPLLRRYCSCSVPSSRYAPSDINGSSKPSLNITREGTNRPNAEAAAHRRSLNTDNSPLSHRTITTSQSLLTHSPLSPGSPLFTPQGTHILAKLKEYLRAQYVRYGYDEVLTPTIYKRQLWQTSGHWDIFKDDMFEVRGRGAAADLPEPIAGAAPNDTPKHNAERHDAASTESIAGSEQGEQPYGLKPMNCPGHCLMFASKTHSYRDLPIRWAEFSPLHRNELASALSGLTRVRRFHQDDAHIFCRPSQIMTEIKATLEFIQETYTIFGLPQPSLVLSTRPETFLGEVATWEHAEGELKAALDESGLKWEENPGDGAFYGPKIDVLIRGTDGKMNQTATVQLDFQLPERFDLKYSTPVVKDGEGKTQGLGSGEDGEFARPVIIHRAVMGSLERFMALILENWKGKYPFWINPNQAVVLPISNDKVEQVEWAKKVQKIVAGVEIMEGGVGKVQSLGRRRFRVETDDRAQSLGSRLRQAKQKGFGFELVVGDQEVKDGTVTIERTKGKKEALTPHEVYQLFVETEAKFQ